MPSRNPLRDCLGRFATGVTVVTCRDSEGSAYGITANSFSSVSLEPPRILWNIAKVSQSLDAYLAATHFGVNILRRDQRELSVHFAQSQHDLYDGIAYSSSPNGAPRLDGVLAFLECATAQIHDCGDHYIIIGDVLTFDAQAGDPLIFFAGDYRDLV